MSQTSILLPVLLLSAMTFSQIAPKVITYDGREVYLNGMNVAWNSFGTDVGMHHEWGGLYDPVWFENIFKKLEQAGANCIRIWIHCDGRSSPEFDDSGYVTGMDFNLLIDFEDMLMRAASQLGPGQRLMRPGRADHGPHHAGLIAQPASVKHPLHHPFVHSDHCSWQTGLARILQEYRVDGLVMKLPNHFNL